MKTTLDEDVQATLERLEEEDRGLKQFLKKAYGYAVFPSVGKAALVVGGSYGRGEVFERGKPIGFATLAQTTIGVQIGGDTYSEVIAFESKEALDRFKKGKVAFAASASAVLVKAGAAATADYEKGVTAFVYSDGGMLLELSIGGQKFKFRPLGDGPEPGKKDQGAEKQGRNQGGQEEDEQDQNEGEEQEGSDSGGGASQGLKRAATFIGDFMREHPVAASLAGAGLAAGVALLVVSRLRRSSQTDGNQEEDNASEDEGDDEQNSGQTRDRSDDQEGEDEKDQDDQDEGQSSEGRNNKGFGRLLSRGRSRP